MLQRGESKRIARAPYGEWIPIVRKVSAEITKQQLNTGSGLWSIRRQNLREVRGGAEESMERRVMTIAMRWGRPIPRGRDQPPQPARRSLLNARLRVGQGRFHERVAEVRDAGDLSGGSVMDRISLADAQQLV